MNLPTAPPSMVHTTLAERFRAEHASEIDVDGQTVHSVLALPVQGRTLLRIQRAEAHPTRPQALRLAAAVGLRVNDHVATEVILRSSTAPALVEVLVEAEDDTVIYVWNTWSVDGVDHAWLADAGMLVDTDLTTEPPFVRLRCRDGAGDASFRDLVVTITATPATEPAIVPAETAKLQAADA